MTKYRWVCGDCGSADVSCDATVRWSVEAQDWEISDVHDGDFCDHCDCEVRLVQEEIV